MSDFNDSYDNTKYIGSINYEIGERIKSWRLKRKYIQEDLARKIGTTYQEIDNYERGCISITIEKSYDIAEALSISIIDLLPELTEDDEVENELPSLIEEYKKIESQELRYALIKSLFEGIRICKEKLEKQSDQSCKKSL